MSNLFRGLKPKAHLSKSGFDLSQRHIFSMKAGMVTPVASIDCVPSDYHEINLASMTRTAPLQTAAYVSCKQYFDVFFVPYQCMWHQWNSFISQRDNPTSASSRGSLYAPNISLGQLLRDGMLANVSDPGHKYGACRLLSMLGYGDFTYYLDDDAFADGEWTHNFDDKYVNMWRLAAYQKIWYDYYRNQYFDTVITPQDWNFDDFKCDSVETSHYAGQRSSNFIRNLVWLRYKGWNKDMFMGLMPSPQFGAVSTVSIFNSRSSTVQRYTGNDVNWTSTSGENPEVTKNAGTGGLFTNGVNIKHSHQVDIDALAGSLSSTFDVLALRRAEALQKWKETTLRAGQRAKNQAIGHFGVAPKYYEDDVAQFLGQFDSTIQISEVIQTSETENTALGDIGGKAISACGGDTIKFNCSDFGVLMVVSYIVPQSDYNAYGLDKNNTLVEPFDYFTPEFENLGLEGVFRYQLDGVHNPLSGYDATLGYAPRYSNYKAAVDKVHFKFMSAIGDDLSAISTYGTWVAPRRDILPTVSGLSLNNLYINPSVLDTIFYAQAHSDETFDSDQFLVNCNLDIKSIRPMSVLGLPQF